MKTRDNNVLKTDRIGPLLVKLTLPAFLGMFVQGLYNVISTIFIGHTIGSLGIAGLSIVFPLQMLVYGFGMMVGIGGASLISRQLGAGNEAGAEKTLGNAISISFILYVFVAILILPFMDFWLGLIGASEDVLPYARDYLVYIVSGSFFMIFAQALLNLARAEGNARVGMIAMVVGALLSIGLSALFIITFDMGMQGAGLATVISQLASSAYLISYYLTRSSYLKLYLKNLYLDLKILKDMLSIGMAAFVQTIANSLSVMILINLVVSYGGDTALSAFGIVQRVMFFAIMPGMVIGQGAQPILGYNYGAKNYRLLVRTINMAAISSTAISILGFLVLYFVPEPLIRIFTDEAEVVSTGAYVAKLMFLSLPLIGLINLGTQMFQAIGKAVQSFITAVVRPIVFLIPLVYILSHAWQLDGVFLSFPAADTLTFVLIILLLAPLVRQYRKLAGPISAGPDPTREPENIIEPSGAKISG